MKPEPGHAWITGDREFLFTCPYCAVAFRIGNYPEYRPLAVVIHELDGDTCPGTGEPLEVDNEIDLR